MKKILAVLVAVVAFFAWPKPLRAGDLGLNRQEANDIQYLVFWAGLPGAANSGNDGFVASIRNFATKLGTSGNGRTRQLGFGNDIPIFVSDESRIAKQIKLNFEFAKETNVAICFSVDDHILWDQRPDLWNWYDPAKRGYNPNNRKNVEWYDWQGTPSKRRYFTPNGCASQSPHMCYNSPMVRKEISRIISQIVGPALREEINKLKQQNKEYLFAGIEVGAEAGIDDYSTFSSRAPRGLELMFMQAKKMMDEDKVPPRSRLGYCALTNAGYSKSRPPANINKALTQINREFIEFWDKQFFDAGIPRSRIYTHVAASSPQDDTNNAPISIVFNPYARPGWTTYPQGILANGFEPLYDELAKNGNPAWGGVEANVIGDADGARNVSWETYLAWHYNHGAKLVGINVGATDQSVMSNLTKAAFNDEAMAAYKKFLRGEHLNEDHRVMAKQIPSAIMQANWQTKVNAIQTQAPLWAQRTGRTTELQPLMMRLKSALDQGNLPAVNSVADEILNLIRQ
jgi:hypothetical protein